MFLVAEGLLHHSSNLFFSNILVTKGVSNVNFETQAHDSAHFDYDNENHDVDESEYLQAKSFCNSLSKLLMRAATE